VEPDVDPEAVLLAVLGLRDAFERHQWSVQAALAEPTPEDLRMPGFPRWGVTEYVERLRLASITAVNFMDWACALDELFAGPDRKDHRPTDRQADYRVRRAADRRGPLLVGLRYVRDRHMHQVVVSAGSGFQVRFGGEAPPTIGPDALWRKADDIGDATDGRQTKEPYLSRRAAYVERMEWQSTQSTLGAVLGCLTAEVQALGVDLPPWPKG
jgi:hypothetical protein